MEKEYLIFISRLLYVLFDFLSVYLLPFIIKCNTAMRNKNVKKRLQLFLMCWSIRWPDTYGKNPI